jgi:CheY-like chemotaxis protein
MTMLKITGDSSTMALRRWEGPSVSGLSSSSEGTVSAGSRAHALVIGNGQSGVPPCRWALRLLDLESLWVSGGLEGIAALRRTRFDVVLIDEYLPDMLGVDVIRTLRVDYDSRRFIMVRSVATGTPAAMTNGDALGGVLERPYRSVDVIAMVDSVLSPNGATGRAGSVAQRWASFVLGAIDAESDPKTVTMWARAVGVSRSMLSECCRLIHVPTHDARDFARFLRAICHAGDQWQPEAVLDVADGRTLRKLHARAGLSTHTGTTPTIRQFLEQQRWIPSANPGLVALSSLLNI